VGAKFARADNQLLFEETSIRSLELSNRAIRSSTWSGVGDQKGYVTDRAVEFYGDLAKCISCNRCSETGMQGLGISCYWERMLKEERRKT
jgi:2,4-dienoyl-CoA reductase-like NADH-dependent reductase (Old Yellow Enzyme family)